MLLQRGWVPFLREHLTYEIERHGAAASGFQRQLGQAAANGRQEDERRGSLRRHRHPSIHHLRLGREKRHASQGGPACEVERDERGLITFRKPPHRRVDQRMMWGRGKKEGFFYATPASGPFTEMVFAALSRPQDRRPFFFCSAAGWSWTPPIHSLPLPLSSPALLCDSIDKMVRPGSARVERIA